MFKKIVFVIAFHTPLCYALVTVLHESTFTLLYFTMEDEQELLCDLSNVPLIKAFFNVK